MMLLGQAKTYDYVISQYKTQLNSNLEDTVIKMLTRCQLTQRVYEQCRLIFKTLKNHKSTVKKLLGFEATDSIQQMADFFSRQTSKLFQHINCFLKEASHHTTLGHNLNEFTYGGNDLK
jgi:predicted transcriptional regulator